MKIEIPDWCDGRHTLNVITAINQLIDSNNDQEERIEANKDYNMEARRTMAKEIAKLKEQQISDRKWMDDADKDFAKLTAPTEEIPEADDYVCTCGECVIARAEKADHDKSATDFAFQIAEIQDRILPEHQHRVDDIPIKPDTPDSTDEMEDMWWCLECHSYVPEGHRCEQWSQTVHIPAEAIKAWNARENMADLARIAELEAKKKLSSVWTNDIKTALATEMANNKALTEEVDLQRDFMTEIDGLRKELKRYEEVVRRVKNVRDAVAQNKGIAEKSILSMLDISLTPLTPEEGK